MDKISLLLLCGGRSGEHEVSLASARSVAGAINRGKYDLVTVTIGQNGVWQNDRGEIRRLAAQPDLGYLLDSTGRKAEKVDVIFPLIHGTFGEDGCLQGLFELAELPYVGSDVLGSALGMDKAVQKRVLRDAGIPVVSHVAFRQADWRADATGLMQRIERELGYPTFIKPVNMGSSVGITKAENLEELLTGIDEALHYDTKIIVEQAVPNAREIECAVLGAADAQASVLGEIKPGNDFYDYQAKYESDDTELVIPADLERAKADELRALAVNVFQTLEAAGLARVDFLMNGETGEYVVNEINTMPGFTQFSMYPKLWEASGLTYGQLIDQLVDLALERAKDNAILSREFIRA